MKNVATIIAIIALLGTFCQSFTADQLPFVSLDTVVLNDAIKPVAPPQPLPGGGKVTGFPSFLSSDLPPQTISQLPQTFSAPVLQPINVPIPTIFNGGYKGDSAVVPIAVEGLY